MTWEQIKDASLYGEIALHSYGHKHLTKLSDEEIFDETKLAYDTFVKNLNIAEYNNAGYAGHLPTRERKLLLNHKEIKKWQAKIKEKGMTIVPLAIFINEKGLAKIEIGLARGKKMYDKRDDIKKKDLQRDSDRVEKIRV